MSEAAIAAHLRAQLATAGIALQVRTGPVREPSANQAVANAVPHQVAFVMSTGGLRTIPFVDGGARTGIRRPTYQVWLRSKPGDYDGGLVLARAVLALLDMQPPPSFIECRTTAPEPLWIQRDDGDHHEWTINLWCQRH